MYTIFCDGNMYTIFSDRVAVDFPLQKFKAECFDKNFTVTLLWRKLLNMVKVTVNKSYLCIVTVEFTNSVLNYTSAGLNWYGRRCTRTQPHWHDTFHYNSAWMVCTENCSIWWGYERFNRITMRILIALWQKFFELLHAQQLYICSCITNLAASLAVQYFWQLRNRLRELIAIVTLYLSYQIIVKLLQLR